MIRSGLQARITELIELIDAHLTDDARALLDDLFTTTDDQNRYRLTLLKKLSQSARPTKIKEAIADHETLADLHDQLAGPLSALDLGAADIQYFAGSVLRPRLIQLQQRADNDRRIHAAAFVAHQFYRTHDSLIDLWLSVMASFHAKATREHNDRLLEARKEQQDHLKAVIDDLDTTVLGLLRDIRGVTEAECMSDAQKVDAIQSLLDQGQSRAFERLNPTEEHGFRNKENGHGSDAMSASRDVQTGPLAAAMSTTVTPCRIRPALREAGCRQPATPPASCAGLDSLRC